MTILTAKSYQADGVSHQRGRIAAMRASGTAVCIAIAMLAGVQQGPDNTDAPAASDTAGAPGIAVTAARVSHSIIATVSVCAPAPLPPCRKRMPAPAKSWGSRSAASPAWTIASSARTTFAAASASNSTLRSPVPSASVASTSYRTRRVRSSARDYGTDAAEAIERAGGTQAEAAAAVARADAHWPAATPARRTRRAATPARRRGDRRARCRRDRCGHSRQPRRARP